jgi:hypothetical protein
MLIGTMILKMGGAAFYSPAFPRGGQAATFGIDVLGEIGGTSLAIDLETRNEDDTTWTSLAAGLFTVTGTGTQQANQATGIRELLRFKYSFTGGSDGDGFMISMGAPSWRPY